MLSIFRVKYHSTFTLSIVLYLVYLSNRMATMTVASTVQPKISLVPRLPCSGMQTLKLCRRGEAGSFSHMSMGVHEKE